jgi:8-amino-7-oxononanoate synthase
VAVLTNPILARLEQQLQKRRDSGKLRQLPSTKSVGIDFSSNDYLGLSRNRQLQQNVEDDWYRYRREHEQEQQPLLGSTGSRLLTGNSIAYEEVERYLAEFHGHPHCLLANSGWDLNFGLISCVLGKDSLLLYDELSHNSLVMGLRSGRQQQNIGFKHNSMSAVRELLHKHCKRTAQEALIVVESIYSMDGDACPLVELLDIAEEFDAMVVVDEAHSTGVMGPRGEGMVSALGVQPHRQLLGVVHTFGKAVGLHGAALMTSHASLIGTMLNYSRPFIYSTSLPVSSVRAVRIAYDAMAEAHCERAKLTQLVAVFRAECEALSLDILPSISPIQGVLIPSNHAVVRAANLVKQAGYTCLPIRAPTVPEGEERLRIVLHAHNSEEEVRGVCRAIKNALTT